ncbi:MAG: ATP-binding protein, partial [Leptospiraceae bacterium]|nr:ATP-binding protein [Leptospiraceae bacterium]
QLETLLEDFSKDPVRGRLERLLKENRRIGSQINKAFELASLMREENLYLEEVVPAHVVERLRVDWSVIHMQDLQTPVRADRRALEGVLRNLVENAVQHGAANSVQISGTAHSNQMEIVVQDNGRGFAGRVSQLSEAFVRHSSTSGTGLGLYIVRRLITKMQGRVRFESNAQGFCVRISLPLYRPKALSAKQNAAQGRYT